MKTQINWIITNYPLLKAVLQFRLSSVTYLYMLHRNEKTKQVSKNCLV